jgi:outer membrane protein assembly factor BamB
MKVCQKSSRTGMVRLIVAFIVMLICTVQSLPSNSNTVQASSSTSSAAPSNSLESVFNPESVSPNQQNNLFPPTGGKPNLAALVTPTALAKVYLPFMIRVGDTTVPSPTPTSMPVSGVEWSQQGHDAQHTGYTDQVVPMPWRWKWSWNGADANGAVVSGKFGLPRNSQPVTGGGRVYVAAGSRGVYAINNTNGTTAWNANPGGSINSTPAYDSQTNAVFALSSNGTLYKLNSSSGAVLGQFATGASSALPLPPAIASDRVLISMGTKVYAINKTSMAQIWAYDAGSNMDSPPAYSPSRNRVIAVSHDLYVHAIDNSNGTRAWRVKPTTRNGGNPGTSDSTLAEVINGWPVIAETHGYVLIKLRLDWQALWGTWSPWPGDNATMRSQLQANPAYQALLALDLDNGATPFVANVGHGGFGDGGYLPMGPQPVVKKFANGQEVAYVTMRGSPCLRTPCDGRWDSHLAEMELDNTTVAGYSAGDVRFMRNTFFPSDEQVNLSMSGDMLLGGHWAFGLAHLITDRSASRGSGSNPIVTTDLPHIVVADTHAAFTSTHYNATSVCAENCMRVFPAGFYIYYTSQAVYDQYWSEYASWVVSNNTIYYVSTDGAIAALENGNPTAAALTNPLASTTNTNPFKAAVAQTQAEIVNQPVRPNQVIPYTQARQYAGQTVTVEGPLQFVFNNYLAVYLGFKNPHQGEFKIRILKKDWSNFAAPPETIYKVGQTVRVTGEITWYQGDPTIYVEDPSEIQVIGE